LNKCLTENEKNESDLNFEDEKNPQGNILEITIG